MRVFVIITLLIMCGCSKNTHTLNHCGGIDIKVCEYEVEGEMSLEEQEKLINNEEELLKKIEECPSKKVREAMRDALNKENTTTNKDG